MKSAHGIVRNDQSVRGCIKTPWGKSYCRQVRKGKLLYFNRRKRFPIHVYGLVVVQVGASDPPVVFSSITAPTHEVLDTSANLLGIHNLLHIMFFYTVNIDWAWFF